MLSIVKEWYAGLAKFGEPKKVFKFTTPKTKVVERTIYCDKRMKRSGVYSAIF